MSGGKGGTQTTTSSPWAGQIPYLTGGAGNPHAPAAKSADWYQWAGNIGQGAIAPQVPMFGGSLGATAQAPQAPTLRLPQMPSPSPGAAAPGQPPGATGPVGSGVAPYSPPPAPPAPSAPDYAGMIGAPSWQSNGFGHYTAGGQTIPSWYVDMAQHGPLAPAGGLGGLGGVPQAQGDTRQMQSMPRQMQAAGSGLPGAEGVPASAMPGGAQSMPGAASGNAVGLFPSASQYMQSQGPQYFDGPDVAFKTPLEAQSEQFTLDSGMGAMADTMGLRPLLSDFYGTTMQSMMDTMRTGGGTPPRESSSGAVDAAVGRIGDQLTQYDLPMAAAGAAGVGGHGGSRHAIREGLVGRGAMDAAGRAAAELENANYNSWLGAWGRGQDQVSRAWSQAPSVFESLERGVQSPWNIGQSTGQLGMQIGADWRNLGDRMLAGDAARSDHYQNLQRTMLDDYARWIGGNYGGTQTAPAPDNTGSMLGGLGSLAMGIASFL